MTDTLRRLIVRAFDPETPPPADPPPAPESTPPPPAPEATPPPSDDSAARLKIVEAELDRARKEAAKYRTRNEEEANAVVLAVRQALGIAPEDAAKDPEALAKKLEETSSRAAELEGLVRELRLEKAFSAAASKTGADPDLTWAVLKARGSVSEVDVDSENLGEALVALIEAEIEKNPKLRQGPGAPTRSGTDISGGTGTKTFTRDELRKMTPEEIEEHFEEIERQMAAGQIR